MEYISDKCSQLNAKAYNKGYITSMTAKLLAYYSDPDKQNRKNVNHLCKCCHYVLKERIGGSMITVKPCRQCGKEMSFGNTCTDKLCDECAEKYGFCKHCGQKMD